MTSKTDMKSWVYFFCILFLCVIFIRATKSQIKIHKNLDVEDGLMQSQALSIHEAQDGYLWIGTADGLSRWDGINFVNFQIQNGLSGNQIFAIHEDANGTLYLATKRGVSLYKNGKITAFHEDKLSNDQITAIAEDLNGTLYFGTRDRGVFVYKKGQFNTLNSKNGLAHNRINSIHINEEGILYLATAGGISIYEKGKLKNLTTKNGLASNSVSSVFEGKDGTVYLGTNCGVSVYRNGEFEILNTKTGLSNDHVNAIYEAADGTLYFGTGGGGITILKEGKFEIIAEEHGLADNLVECISETKNGVIYFGTSAGVSIYEKGKFETLNHKGLTKNSVQTIYGDSNGAMYFSGYGNGVIVYKNGELEKLSEEDGLVHNWVLSISEGKDGTLYFGTDFSGISLYKNNKFQTLNKENGLPSNNVFSMYTGRDGTMYFGFWNAGVVAYKDSKFIRTWNQEKGLPNSPRYTIHESKDGALYLGTRGSGVFIYQNEQLIKTLNENNGLVSNHVYSIYEAKDGTFYFGTPKGLNLFKNGQFDTIDVRHGLTSNKIYGILEDDTGKIYLTTNKGVNILDFSNDDLFVRTLRYSDGLASDECKENIYYKDINSRFWFGTVKGISRYDPKKDTPNKMPPKVHVTRISLFEEDIPLTQLTDNPVFKHDQNYFKFDFIGINLFAPEKVTYRYRLSGVDKDWVETRKRSVQYTNLNDANYIFELKARNEWGIWSETIKLDFRILPPFWERWWFILIVVLFIGGTTAYLIMNHVKQLLATERLRTKIAADLHDSIGSDLAEITIMSEVSIQHLNQEAKKQATESLKKISQISRSAVKSMSDIVWLVNPKRDSLYDLILRLRDSYEELFLHKGIELDIQNLEALSNIHLPMEYRQHLYLIFKEGMNNSLKHSNCKKIVLDTIVTDRQLRMVLKDDGKGFDMEKTYPGNDSGDGLANMKKRAESSGGTLNIISTENQGAAIEFIGKI